MGSNVLHSTEDAATNILVPDFTVHVPDAGGPKRRNRAAEVDAAVGSPRKGFWALGV